MNTTPTRRTDRPPVPPPGLPPPGHAADLAPAAAAIARGARLSIGPLGGIVTRAPEAMQGEHARRFAAAERAALQPVFASPDARAALLRLLAPPPHGWGGEYGGALVALLWGVAVARLPPRFMLRRGHLVTDAARFVAALRADVLRGPAWTDRHGVERWTPRLHTGALLSDLYDLDAVAARPFAAAPVAVSVVASGADA